MTFKWKFKTSELFCELAGRGLCSGLGRGFDTKTPNDEDVMSGIGLQGE